MKSFTEFLSEASFTKPLNTRTAVKMKTPRFKRGDSVTVRLNSYTTAHGIVDRVGDFGYHVKFAEGKPPSFHEPDHVHANYEEASKADERVRLKVPVEKKK